MGYELRLSICVEDAPHGSNSVLMKSILMMDKFVVGIQIVKWKLSMWGVCVVVGLLIVLTDYILKFVTWLLVTYVSPIYLVEERYFRVIF